jgi:hypothetical protein
MYGDVPKNGQSILAWGVYQNEDDVSVFVRDDNIVPQLNPANY